jgi:hypothetical protein
VAVQEAIERSIDFKRHLATQAASAKRCHSPLLRRISKFLTKSPGEFSGAFLVTHLGRPGERRDPRLIRHCERSEAIQFLEKKAWIASELLLLAMTARELSSDPRP